MSTRWQKLTRHLHISPGDFLNKPEHGDFIELLKKWHKKRRKASGGSFYYFLFAKVIFNFIEKIIKSPSDIWIDIYQNKNLSHNVFSMTFVL